MARPSSALSSRSRASASAAAKQATSAARSNPRPVHLTACNRGPPSLRPLASASLSPTPPRLATLHGDVQTDPADIPQLLAARNGAEAQVRLFAGWRVNRQDSGSKRWASTWANAIRARMLRDDTLHANMKELEDVGEYERLEIQHFFEVYKDLEPGKSVEGAHWAGREEAEAEIKASFQREIERRTHATAFDDAHGLNSVRHRQHG